MKDVLFKMSNYTFILHPSYFILAFPPRYRRRY